MNNSSDRAILFKKHCSTLKLYQRNNYPEVISVVDDLYNEFTEVYNLNLTRPQSIAKFIYHIEFFVLNLYKAYCLHPERVISFPRNRSMYSGKKSRYKNKLKLSYRYSVDKGEDGKPVIIYLEDQGYIETFNYFRDDSGKRGSYQSRMRAKEKLINLINQYNVSEDMVEQDDSNFESVRMKGVKSKPKWDRDYDEKKGKFVRKKIKGVRKPCKTPDTKAVRLMRENLEVINAVMDAADIKLDISPEELEKLNKEMMKDMNPNKRFINFSRKRVYRVFLDRRLDRGGRFYGPWYQNINKQYRQFIIINDAPTLELDYSAFHAHLLYFWTGKTPPEGDLYELDGHSRGIRDFLKNSFLRIINSKNMIEAKGSIRQKAFNDDTFDIPPELDRLQDKYLDPLLEEFLEKHEAVRDYIFTTLDLGNILQNIDSKISEKVLLHFANQGIPVLPMHDSYIIYAWLIVPLKEVMDSIILNKFHASIPITNDNFESLLARMFDRMQKMYSEGEYMKIMADLEDYMDGVRERLPGLKEMGGG